MAYIGKIPATGAFQKCDALTATTTADYTLQVGSVNVVPESVNHMIVSLNGVIQEPGSSGGFTVSGSTLSFASALIASDSIDFVMLLGNVLDIGVCTDNTVSTAKIVDDAVTGAKIVDDAIDSEHYAAGSIDKEHLADQVDIFAGTSLTAADLGSGVHLRTADSSASAHANADELVVEGSAASGISILSGTGSDGAIYFGDSGDDNIGMVRYEHSGNNLIFRTNASDRLSINGSGAVNVVGAFSKGSGSFKIDHPLPAKKNTHHLIHSFVESPKADLIYRGKATLIDGSAIINIDTVSNMTEGTFVLLCDDVQCFTSNESDWDAVKGSVIGNILTIQCENSSSTANISWMVVGDRKDEHIMNTEWTDENGKPIIEPEKEEEKE